MAGSAPDPGRRLDSWKAIAEYLHRDVGTVRRWEKTQRLPVRRVPGGRGSSVFAYAAEIDRWLGSASSAVTAEASPAPSRTRRWWPGVAAGALALIGLAAWRTWTGDFRAEDLRVQAGPNVIIALDRMGVEQWRYRLAPGAQVAWPTVSEGIGVVPGPPPAVYAVTSHSYRQADRATEGGQFVSLDLRGRLRWSMSIADELTFGGKTFGPPWALTAFAADDRTGTRRLAVAAHHYLWSPSVVAFVDDQGRRVGTFAHSGWIENLHWLEGGRLLAGGFSEAHDGGMVALLDPARVDAQGPEPEGSVHHCDTCGEERPLRMVVMPRSEVNRVTHAPFNRTVVEVVGDRVVVHTIEVPSAGQEAVDALYEFTMGLELIRASFSERYWEIHQGLEGQARLDHSRETCPDRDGPRELLVWSPEGGWATVATR